MKRILFISPQPFFQWRGTPIRVSFNVRALAELGYQVDLLTLPVGDDLQIPGVRVIRVPNIFGVKNIRIGPSINKVVFDVILFVWAICLMRKNRYDVVHGVEDAGVIGLTIARMAGKKSIFEKHSDPSSYKKGMFRNLILSIYGLIEKFTAMHVNAVVCTGPGLVKQVLDSGVIKPVHHIFDIPSSLTETDDLHVKSLKSKLKKIDNETLITYVGSFAVYQGVDLLFSSIPNVVRNEPKARFIIIGGTRAEIDERKKWLADRNLNVSVTFLGKVPPDELPDYLAASDILLAPRLAGVNTPLKLLDYMKVGRAIVATDVKANRLILDDTQAILVQPDPVKFAEGICNLIENEKLRVDLGENCHKLYVEKYNYKEFKRRLSVCYQGVLK
jgi:glycosyltransferase involved in cell wall biosynthesis